MHANTSNQIDLQLYVNNSLTKDYMPGELLNQRDKHDIFVWHTRLTDKITAPDDCFKYIC